ETGTQLDPDRLRGLPDLLARREVLLLLEPRVDLVRRDLLAVELELEAVELLDLLRLGRDLRVDEILRRLRARAGVEEDRLQLLRRERGELGFVGEEASRLLDVLRAAGERGHRPLGGARALLVRRVALDDVRLGDPVRLVRGRLQPPVLGRVATEELLAGRP